MASNFGHVLEGCSIFSEGEEQSIWCGKTVSLRYVGEARKGATEKKEVTKPGSHGRKPV
jgi:hypothetical protein